MKVKDPQGRTITVRRRWLPWRRRIHMPEALSDVGGGAFDLPTGDDPISLIIAAVMLVVLAPFILVAALILGELLILLLLIPLVIPIRLWLNHPWQIEVRHRLETLETDSVPGWTESSLRIHDLAQAAERGEYAEQLNALRKQLPRR